MTLILAYSASLVVNLAEGITAGPGLRHPDSVPWTEWYHHTR